MAEMCGEGGGIRSMVKRRLPAASQPGGASAQVKGPSRWLMGVLCFGKMSYKKKCMWVLQ